MSRLIYLGKGLALSPDIMQRMVDQVDPNDYEKKLAPDRFTLREVLAHVADLEPVILYRMHLAVESPGSEIPNWDQDKEAIAKNYAEWEVQTSLDKFKEVRAKTVEYFESLTDEQTRLTLQHPVLGEISIFDIATFILGHDTYHFDQISQYM